MTTFFKYFLLFLSYSIIGWICEVIFVYRAEKKFVDRGFLLGPYCPIYGFGALIITLYLNQYKNNIITVFIMSMVLCSILEYITSYIMEKLFKARWWDYSEKKFNLNGRICGENALLFGIGSIFVIYILNPIIKKLYINLNITALYIISIIGLVLFLTDTIISFNIIKNLKNTVSNIEVRKDSTQEITRIVKEKLTKNNKIFQHRLIKAFPKLDLSKIVKIRRNKIKNLKELLTKK